MPELKGLAIRENNMQEKGKHYVIGDVHGCYEDFLLLKEKIEKRDPEATIILTGDFLDRGLKFGRCLVGL